MTSNLPTQYQPAAPIPRPGGALSLAHMTPADAWRFAEALAGSGMLPRQYQGNPASVLWALEYGRAIGLDVITTTQSVHVIQGRATASADLMASLTRRAGHRMRISGDDQRAEVVIIRADDPEFEFRVEWTVQRAQRAKLLGKDTWQQYPAAMLRARAISECVRMACPEVLHGSIYTPEEIGARVDADGVPLDAEVQQLRPVETAPAAGPVLARDYLAEARAAKTPGEVRDIYAAAGQDPAATPDLARQLEAIGREKAAALAKQAWPAGDEPTDAEVVDDSEDGEHAQAVAELRGAAEKAGVPDIDAEFEQSYGAPINKAATASVREMTAILRGAA